MFRLNSTIALIGLVVSGNALADACPESAAAGASTAGVPASCTGVAPPAPWATGIAYGRMAARPAPVDPAAGYRKKTEFDNTPYRFNAEKGFTAAEFEAWMAARGIRIATGKPTRAPVAAQAVATDLADPSLAPVAVPVTTEAGSAPPAVVPAVVTTPAQPAPAPVAVPTAIPVVPACRPGTGLVSC